LNPIGTTTPAFSWGAPNSANGRAVAADTRPVPYASHADHPMHRAGFRMRYSVRNPALLHALISLQRRHRPVPPKPQALPIAPARPILPIRQYVPRPAPAVVVPALNASWIDDLDLKSFDDIAFLRECGEAIGDSASLDLRLEAAHRCLAPRLLPGRSALSLEGLDSMSRSLFFQRLMPALGLGRLPAGGLDPAFAQYLFQRWFLSLASPPSSDGNGGFDAFPLLDRLLALTYAMPASVATCADGSRKAVPIQVDDLYRALAEQFLREFSYRPPALQEWITASLIDVFEPTLTRPDLPPQLRYGGLEWALLAIGINLTGARHWDYSHQELVGLAIAANVFDELEGLPADVSVEAADVTGATDATDTDTTDTIDATDTTNATDILNSTETFSRAAIGPVLRMAHAEGAIDLRNADANADTDAAGMLQTAIALFGVRMEGRRRTASIGSFFEALPVRRDVAMTMLREHGLDPLRRFRVAKPRGHGRGLLGGLQKTLKCMEFNDSYELVDFFMSDCLRQLLVHGKLPVPYANRLHATLSKRSHTLLNQRFNNEFDAAFNALSDSVFAEVLGASLLTMNARDRQFWHCGRASIRIPKVDILTRISARPSLGAIGAGRPIVSKVKNYEATGGLFAQLTLEENGFAERRDYWVTLEPLTVERFDGDTARILSKKLDHFFQVDNPEESLLSLNLQQPIGFRQVDCGNASFSSLQFVGRQLLAPRVGAAREMAFQMTGPEYSHEQLYQSLLDLLPLRACIQSISDERHYRAVFFCATDVLSLIPLLRTGGQVVGQVARMGAVVPAAQGRKLAVSLLTGVVERDIAPLVVSSTLRVGRPLLHLARQGGRWLNPTNGMASGLSWALTQARRGSLQLLQRLRRVPILHRLVTDVERRMTWQRMFYRDRGFWRATPGAVLLHPNGQRQLSVGGTTYPLADIGQHNDVVTIRQGGHSHLVNPESGFAIRPIPDSKQLSGQSASPAASGASGTASALSKRRLCRVRRGNPESVAVSDPCNLIERAPAFGEGFYRLTPADIFYGVQARIQRQNSGQRTFELVPVDLNNMAVASYSMQQATGQRNQLKPVSNDRYFVFEDRVWIADNDRLKESAMLCPFPVRVQGTIIASSEAGIGVGMGIGEGVAGGGLHYLAFDIKLPAIPGDPLTYFNKFVVPYGNYPGKKDQCMGMIELPGIAYKFQVKGGWLAPQKPGTHVALEKTDEEDFRRFEQYRRINLNIRGVDDMFERSSMHQMKNAGIETQRRFDLVFQRAKELVELARRALEMHTLDAYNVLRMFLPPNWSLAREDAFIAALRDNLYDIRSALPIVRKSRYEVIGFGDAKRDITNAGPLVLALPLMDEGELYVRAEALAGSMRIDMDFPFINKALIYFDTHHFNTALIDSLASDLVHELSHARFDSRDTISADSDIMLYPRTSMVERNGVDIGPLVLLIDQTGHESVNHASTFEHLIVTLAYTQSSATQPLLTNLLNGKKSYALRADGRPEQCADSCVVLR
jgi:hypothetical protein